MVQPEGVTPTTPYTWLTFLVGVATATCRPRAALEASSPARNGRKLEMIDLPKWLLPDPFPDPGSWESVRRPPRHTDQGVTGTTRVWLRKLPIGRRPQALCLAHPRVVNRIAWCWNDALLARQVLDDLLADRRGGREGFPRVIVAELKRLRDYMVRHGAPEADAGFWGALQHFWPRH